MTSVEHNDSERGGSTTDNQQHRFPIDFRHHHHHHHHNARMKRSMIKKITTRKMITKDLQSYNRHQHYHPFHHRHHYHNIHSHDMHRAGHSHESFNHLPNLNVHHHHNRHRHQKSPFNLVFHHVTLLLILLLLGVSSPVVGSYDVCDDPENNLLLACNPSFFDAARASSLKLTLTPPDATCGTPANNYQRLGDRSNTPYKCDATSTSGDAHPIGNIIDNDRKSWWQSDSQKDQNDLAVNLTLSFNKLYRLAGDVVLTFNSGRPEKMVLEKSVDNGATWTPLQFYARNCNEFKDDVDLSATVTKQNPAVVVCTNRQVELQSEPLPGGQIKFDLDSRFQIFLEPPTLTNFPNFYQALDTQMLDFLIFSDLRFRFQRPATDGRGDYNRYYYAIQDVTVIARCFCNLHASVCKNVANGLVCDCQHNTQGKNCEDCLPLYNERPWARGSYLPYNQGKANECKKCECNEHALSCTYDSTYGRGVCNSCADNTAGKHCELCLELFYPNTTTTLSDPKRCLACECEPLGVEGDNLICAQTAVAPNPIGQCPCKAQVTGRKCDACISGFYGLLQEPNRGSCTACECDLDGTEGQSNRCAQDGGQCPCKSSTTGRQCNTCSDQFFGFPKGKPLEGCTACGCNQGGSTSLTCNKDTGICTCKSGIDGDKCDKSSSGSYVPAMDSLSLEPESGGCQLTSDLYTDAAPVDGTGFAKCDLSTSPVSLTFSKIEGAMIQAALQWPYYASVRYTNKNSQAISGKITLTYQGNTPKPLSPLSSRIGTGIAPGCPGGSPIEKAITLPTGSSTAVLLTSDPFVMDARCQFAVTLTLNPPTPGRRKKRQAGQNVQTVEIDSVSFLPALTNTDQSTSLSVYSVAADKAALQKSYQDCLQKVAVLRTRNSAMSQAPCDQLLFGVSADINGKASACACSEMGSQFSSQCASLGGQCTCKDGVGGRACDSCLPGYFNFTSEGCQPCNCYGPGSQNGACDLTTGQCPCLSNIMTMATAGQDNKKVGRTCGQCLVNYYGIKSGQGCTACACNSQGSMNLQCDDVGQCPCKDSVQGLKCDQCKSGFFDFGAEGCSACGCSEAGSTGITCDQATGVCTCKENVQGNKCTDCKAQMFNLASHNPKGCQPCFCFGHGQQCTSATGYESGSIRVKTAPPVPLNVEPLYGQRHTSFGSELSLGLSADFALNIENKKLLTFEGNGKSMYHRAKPATTVPRDATLAYKVRLLEGDWKKDVDGTPADVTAAEMMGILAALTKVTFLTRSQGQDVRLTFLEMEIPKENTTSTDQVMSVEQCTCNPVSNVAGLSCESCAVGFKRPNGESSTSYDTCQKCNCNNRGATDPPQCDQVTGVCLNCRNGTIGSQCESCGPNVGGTNCDACLDEFWGLQQDGCRPCACSSPGSQGKVCDKVTGQCTCAAHVVGRTCDKCEENYHRLTAEGCIECDSCYSLLKETVGNLRTIRDTLAKNVSTIQERYDSNPMTKPFTVRFQETADNTKQLIEFLDSAEASETQVQAQILSFNSTLRTLESQLMTMDMTALPVIETNLATAENAITKAQQDRSNLETSSKEASSKLASLETQSITLSNLANDLKTAKDTLQALADASTADSEILKELSTLNTTVLMANQLANELQAKAQSALTTQKNTTGKLLSLEKSIIALVNKATETSTKATNLATQSQETSDVVTKLQKNLADLTAFVIDFNSLKTRTDSAVAVTDSHKSQMSIDQTAFANTKTKAEATVDVVKSLTDQSTSIGTTAASWIIRSQKAEEQAQMILQKSKTIFDETEATLALLQNFNTKATEVETQANEKLAQVSSVQSLSKKLIEDSQTLTTSLSSLQQTASSAKETSEQGKQVIQTKLTQIEGVGRQAGTLKEQLKTVDPGASKRLENINTARTNIVKPGEELCSNVNNKLTTFNTELASTDTMTSNALEKVGNITERANKMLTQLRGLEKVDVEATQTLYNQILDAQSSLKVEELTALINGLLSSKATQGAEIDRLKLVRDSLREKVNGLKTLLQQIRPAGSP